MKGAVRQPVPRLTGMRVGHRLQAVFRGVVALIAVAMLSISGSASGQHVHAYADHDHADHHHGPASHEHHAAGHGRAHAHARHLPDAPAHVEGCDPGEHAVSVVFTCVAAHTQGAPVPVSHETLLVPPADQEWRQITLSDVRAHSPPRLTDAPLRAPPVVSFA